MSTHGDDTGAERAIYEPERLNLTEFGRLLQERRGKLSIRQAAADAGVSFSTFARVEAGAHPDLATFTTLCAWLRVPPARFFAPVVERQRTPLEDAVTHLQADPRLLPEARIKLTTMLTDLYNALASDPPASKPLVACHLRAAGTLRPGVPHRLAGILTDMHRELERQIESGAI